MIEKTEWCFCISLLRKAVPMKSVHRDTYKKVAVFGCLIALGAYGIYFIVEVVKILMNAS